MKTQNIWLFLLLIWLVMACNSPEKPLPSPQPATLDTAILQQAATPVPTRVITLTPQPSATPAPSATPLYDLTPYEGEWTLLLRYEIIGGALVDTAAYTATAGVTVSIDGVVFGAGVFKPAFTDADCIIWANQEEGLNFAINGAVRPSGESLLLDLNILPTNPNFQEQYTTRCFDKLDGTEKEGTLITAQLWKVLQAAQQLQHTFDLAQYATTITLEEQDVSRLSNGQLSGRLTGEVYFGR